MNVYFTLISSIARMHYISLVDPTNSKFGIKLVGLLDVPNTSCESTNARKLLWNMVSQYANKKLSYR